MVVTRAQRATLVSTGEHIAAETVLRGTRYTAEDYIRAVDLARAEGLGEAYAERVAGPDPEDEAAVAEQERGEALVRSAESRLRRRGINPDSASYQQFAAALAELAP
jgi:hypothetical protein